MGYFWHVLYGTDDIRGVLKGQMVAVDQVYVHPRYNYLNMDMDFALFRLKEALRPSRQWRPISIATDFLLPSHRCIIMGWGATNNPSDNRELLHEAKIVIVDRSVCKEKVPGYQVTDNMFCARADPGDSGICMVRSKKSF